MATVIRNHNHKTGILLKQGTKYSHVILMSNKGIKVSRICNQVYSKEWVDMVYDLKVCAGQLLQSGKKRFGITPAAEAELLKLANLKKWVDLDAGLEK
jgi:hypothetical protein